MTTATTAAADAPLLLETLVLQARVIADGRRFCAIVDALELPDADGGIRLVAVAKLGLEGSGGTPSAAENALVQTVRNWLERQDTAGSLPETLGIDGHIDEETEIILHFANRADHAAASASGAGAGS